MKFNLRESLPELIVGNTVQTVSTTDNNILCTSQSNCFIDQVRHIFFRSSLHLICHVLLSLSPELLEPLFTTLIPFNNIFQEQWIYITVNPCTIRIVWQKEFTTNPTITIQEVWKIFILSTIRRQTHHLTSINGSKVTILCDGFVCLCNTRILSMEFSSLCSNINDTNGISRSHVFPNCFKLRTFIIPSSFENSFKLI